MKGGHKVRERREEGERKRRGEGREKRGESKQREHRDGEKTTCGLQRQDVPYTRGPVCESERRGAIQLLCKPQVANFHNTDGKEKDKKTALFFSPPSFLLFSRLLSLLSPSFLFLSPHSNTNLFGQSPFIKTFSGFKSL